MFNFFTSEQLILAYQIVIQNLTRWAEDKKVPRASLPSENIEHRDA